MGVGWCRWGEGCWAARRGFCIVPHPASSLPPRSIFQHSPSALPPCPILDSSSGVLGYGTWEEEGSMVFSSSWVWVWVPCAP